jgi:PAS domain S-box-containing protein
MRVEHPVIVEDLGTETRFSGPPLLHAHNVISGMSVVIAGPDHPWGVLGVHTRQHRLFTREDTDFLRSMANILAEAIERYDADAEIQRYKDIVDTSVDLIAYVDNDYCYRAVNQPYLEFAGKPRDLVIGHTVEEVLGRDYFYNIAKSNIDRCLRGESVRVQRWIDMPDGSRVYEDATMNPERDETGEIKGMVFSGRDITGLKIMEEALQKSAWQLQEAQHIARMGFWEFDIIKDQHTWSDEIYSIFGVSRGDFIPNHENLATIIHPDDVKWVESERKKAVSTSNHIDYEYRINRRDSGEVRFVHVLGDVNRDEKNNPVRLFGTVLDITERKLAENKLTQSRERLRNLVIRLQAVREEERTLIAREIHDELGQGLTALKIDLSLLKSRLPAAWKKIPAHLQKMIAEIDSTIDYVRKLSSSLRPPILDDLGLDAAIEWQIQGFAARTKCDYSLDIQPSPYEYDYDRETAVFRIFQEALNNVARHANAGHVGVRLHYRGRFLLMNLVDNGVGISSEKISDPHSIGLIGMHERAAMFGGKVEISSVASGGTSVAVTLPFPEPSS